MQTIHHLSFEIAPWITPEFTRFRVGTCHGLWAATPHTYDILAIDNDCPGNGHFEDVLQWFESSCRRDGKSLRFLELINTRFREHLIDKRGFSPIGKRHVIKQFI